MLTVSIWNQITTEFFGRSVYGSGKGEHREAAEVALTRERFPNGGHAWGRLRQLRYSPGLSV
jgi:hypothetical protein